MIVLSALIGHAIIRTANTIRRRTVCGAAGEEASDCGAPATAAQNFFLFQIYRRTRDGGSVYQRDLEREFSLRRSTASGILAKLEKSGLLRRETSPGDARMKNLVLTDRALALCRARERRFDDFEKALVRGLTRQEQEQLLTLLERVRRSAEEEMPGEEAEK